ncbi:hypothetical protein D3C72_139880 [compost metagenome]
MTALEGVADFMGYNSEIPKLRRERKAILPFDRLIGGGALLSLSVNPKAIVYFFLL